MLRCFIDQRFFLQNPSGLPPAELFSSIMPVIILYSHHPQKTFELEDLNTLDKCSLDPRRLDWLSNMIARLFSQYNYFKGWSLHSVKYKIGPSLSFAVITVVKDQFIVCTYAKLIARLSALNTVPSTTQTCYPISLN